MVSHCCINMEARQRRHFWEVKVEPKLRHALSRWEELTLRRLSVRMDLFVIHQETEEDVMLVSNRCWCRGERELPTLPLLAYGTLTGLLNTPSCPKFWSQ